MKRAVVPGTFDPITIGHLDVITRASQLVDEVIVAVAASPMKAPLFTLEERTSFVEKTVSGIPNVKVMSFSGLLVDFVQSVEANIIVKGLRALTDFEYEFQMSAMNYELAREIETVFIMAPPQFMYLSSSMVRELASLGGNIQRFVSPPVAEALNARFGGGVKVEE